jgi:DNA (cytosine-5)-methyltransferase 1
MKLTQFSLFTGIGGFEKGIEDAQTEIKSSNSTNSESRISQHGRRAFHKSTRRQQKEPTLPKYKNNISLEIPKSEQPTFRRNDIDFECIGYSEIDRYANAIFQYHYPNIRNYGDATKINYRRLPDFNLFTFGWPCQDNSIAGQRVGQREGTRSGLLSTAVEILRIKQPRYFVAENVPGLFSVNEGLDFYSTIRLFTEAGYDVQWQVLNTRWFLPQNRERIYFVGHLRGERRPQVFPIGEDDKTYHKNNDGVKAVVNCLDSNYSKGFLDHGQRTMVYQKTSGQSVTYKENEIDTLQAGGTDKVPNILIPIFDDKQHQQNRRYDSAGISPSVLTPSGGNHMPKILAMRSYPRKGNREQDGVRFQPLEPHTDNTSNTLTGVEKDNLVYTARTNRSSGIGSPFNSKQNWDTYLLDGSIRRLTPIECERLQGFPDNWTKYGLFENDKVKEISDTQRYKTIGNAVSTPIVKAVMIKLLQSLEGY